MTYITRWLHRHGFGIHSPLAFTIATEAIAQPKRYRYYEEEASEASSPHNGMTAHTTRQIRLRHLIHRLNYRQQSPITFSYIINPTPENIHHHTDSLRQQGGIIFEAKDYLVIIQRRELSYYHYLI
ncbi:MAG: hypothetical protein K2H86_03985 [Muribaculaceae bacterium]|nr:hypothetical protein [Muribaculaceae bacterium]